MINSMAMSSITQEWVKMEIGSSPEIRIRHGRIDTNGVEVHLFEVLERSKYIYQGVVHLCGRPYQENQKDDSCNMRKVWMFPLSTSGHTTVTKSAFDSYSKTQEKKAEALDPK